MAIAYVCFVHGEKDLVAVWLYLTLLPLAGSLLIAICARDLMSVRVRGEVPAAPVRRFASFFLFSGSANGVAFAALLIALTVAAGEIFDRQLGRSLGGLPVQFLGFCAYVLAYALLAVLLQRHWLHRWFKLPQTWVLALVLIAFFSLAPPVTGFLLAPDAVARSLDFGLWTILNPFSPFQNQVSELGTRFALGWAAVMAIFAGRWFVAQVRAFRPPDEPRAEVAVPATLITDPEGSGG